MLNINRRDLLKLGFASAVGACAGEAMFPIKLNVNNIVEKETGIVTGNAHDKQRAEDHCRNDINTQQCFQDYQLSTVEKINAIIVSPIAEEIIFRGIPSYLAAEQGSEVRALTEVLYGTGKFSLSRRELIVGGISSAIFGGLHGLTSEGIKSFPASQTLGGITYWYLQRKLGIVSNTIAHMINNLKVYA